MNLKPVFLFDTTLRDGELSPAFSPSPAERSSIAGLLDSAGVSVIELASTDDSAESLAQSLRIASKIETSTVCCLSRLNPEHFQIAKSFLDNIEGGRIHLYLDSKSMRQVESSAEQAEEILSRLSELISTARTAIPEVEFSPQDATRFRFETLARVIEVAVAAGAGIVSISDTVGTATSEHIRNLFGFLSANVTDLDTVTLSLHAHNHEGRAVENALAAIECGVTQIEGTVNGVGPAGGNTDLLRLVSALECREDIGLGVLDTGSLHAIVGLTPVGG